jgi:MbtH protein
MIEELFTVVVNHEEQYSLWPCGRPIPAGWKIVGKPCSREVCLDWIETNWTDMRPASLRAFMDRSGST